MIWGCICTYSYIVHMHIFLHHTAFATTNDNLHTPVFGFFSFKILLYNLDFIENMCAISVYVNVYSFIKSQVTYRIHMFTIKVQVIRNTAQNTEIVSYKLVNGTSRPRSHLGYSLKM